jgi:hypothetical protein
VYEEPSAGLTPASLSGSGWICLFNSVCSRSDPLGPGNNYPPVTVTVNVAANATSPQVNAVTLGLNSTTIATATDSTIILPSPVLIIALTHSGSFTQGQASAAYTAAVSNAAVAGPTYAPVTVTEIIPTGLTLVSMQGSGWTCSSNTCARSDSLPAGSSYSAITVTVSAASNAPLSVTNQASVAGGGSAAASASDVTSILPFACETPSNSLVSVAGVQRIVNEALGVAPAVDDLTHDGAVNVADVQKLVNAVLGLGCPY